MKNIEKTNVDEQEPDTPENAVERITEEINRLLEDYPAGIPSETLDTADESIPREKIKHPARVTWFTMISLMFANLSKYNKQHLIYVPPKILNDIRELDHVISNINPHRPIEHVKITEAARLMKNILKEILPGVQH